MARIGQLLVRADLVSENNLARALGIQHFAGGRLGTLLLERGSIDEDSLGKTLALQHGCEYIPWRTLSDVSAIVIAALPAKFAIKHAAVPFERGESYLKIALRDPGDLRILDELFFVTGRKIIAGVAPEVRIYQALEKYYGERRTPRYAILAEKISRPMRTSRLSPNAPPPPPEFFPGPKRRPSRSPAPQEVWGEAAESDAGEPSIIQSWKLPDHQVGGWAGIVSPGMGPPASVTTEPETISWEEMPAVPSMWLPEPPPGASENEAPPASTTALQAAAAPPAEPLASAALETPPESRMPSPPAAPEPGIPLPAASAQGIDEVAASEPPASTVSRVERVPAPPALAPLRAGAPEAPVVVVPAPPTIEAPVSHPPVAPEAAEISAVPVPAAPALKPPTPHPEPPPAAEVAEPVSAQEPVPTPIVPISVVPPPRILPVAPTAAALSTAPSPTDFPEVAAAADRDSIATAALTALARRFVRGAVFVAKPEVVTAWGGAGDGISPEELRDIAIPWSDPSVFLNVRLSRAFYLGPLPPLPRHEAIAIAMGGWPDECLVQPILIREKPVAFLYAEFEPDQGASPMDLAYMRELAAAASAAFVSAIRLKKKEI